MFGVEFLDRVESTFGCCKFGDVVESRCEQFVSRRSENIDLDFLGLLFKPIAIR